MKTTTSLLAAFAALVLLATAAAAEEETSFPVATALDARLQALPDSWQDRWDAYQEVKEPLIAERETLAPFRDLWRLREAWRKREAEGEEALTSWEKRRAAEWDALSEAERAPVATWDAFIPVQTRVAASLRRDQLSLGAILMGFFAATHLWCGFAVTTTIAMRSEKAKREAQAG